MQNYSKVSTSKKRKFFIPPFYDFKTTSLGKDNFKLVTIDGQTKLYITPLIRTILENIKSLNKPGQESLCRSIKEKLDSNSRLLLKKSTEKSKIVTINSKQFIFVNANISIVDDNTLRIKNDKQFETNLI